MGPAVFFYALTSYQGLPSMPLTTKLKQIKYLLFLNVIRTVWVKANIKSQHFQKISKILKNLMVILKSWIFQREKFKSVSRKTADRKPYI